MLSERAPVLLELRPEIDLAGVSKSYGRGRDIVRAVDDVSLGVRHNEFVSVLGPSGCGKSTLMLMIAGLVKPSEGTISIQGRAVDGRAAPTASSSKIPSCCRGAQSPTTCSCRSS